ncbi:MAG: hypothetical protein PHW82_17605 [Bacteroidales bacterium]|nr:hypothetical protein [Bacteroidales bacterium]
MRKKSMLVVLILLLSMCICACTHQQKGISQSVSKDAELNTVANNISLKVGTNYDGDTVLQNTDLIGFNYKYDETSQAYVFTFKLTDEGQKKMTESTTKLAETSGDLSLWIGNEVIVSAKVMQPITGDEFAVNMVDINKDSISGVVDKLSGE